MYQRKKGKFLLFSQCIIVQQSQTRIPSLRLVFITFIDLLNEMKGSVDICDHMQMHDQMVANGGFSNLADIAYPKFNNPYWHQHSRTQVYNLSNPELSCDTQSQLA